MCMQMYLFLLFLVGICSAEVYTCEKDIEIPNLQLCGMSQQEFCTQQQRSAPAPVTWCELTPVGTMILMDGECPSGFADMTETYENRLIGVGQGTRGSPTSNGQFPVEGTQRTISLASDSFDRGLNALATPGHITPPSVLFRLCRREGSCQD